MFRQFLAAMFLMFAALEARASECLAMARLIPGVQFAALTEKDVGIAYAGHSTFIIESAGGVRVATDYAGFAGAIMPDVVTMNRAHRSHYTNTPDPAIKHVLRGWTPDGTPAGHDVKIGDVRIRNVTTDIRGGELGRVTDGNSIFVFEVAGLCIGHLGHLHHELSPGHIGLIGRLDIVMVPVDGGYTMAQVNMMEVLKTLKTRIVIPMHYFGPDTLARFIANAEGYDVEYAKTAQVVLSLDSLPEKPKVLVLPGY